MKKLSFVVFLAGASLLLAACGKPPEIDRELALDRADKIEAAEAWKDKKQLTISVRDNMKHTKPEAGITLLTSEDKMNLTLNADFPAAHLSEEATSVAPDVSALRKRDEWVAWSDGFENAVIADALYQACVEMPLLDTKEKTSDYVGHLIEGILAGDSTVLYDFFGSGTAGPDEGIPGIQAILTAVRADDDEAPEEPGITFTGYEKKYYSSGESSLVLEENIDLQFGPDEEGMSNYGHIESKAEIKDNLPATYVLKSKLELKNSANKVIERQERAFDVEFTYEAKISLPDFSKYEKMI